MKSRKFSISILFIASYLILAITAISHHHHQDRICTEITHCFNESKENHQHDSEENGNLCFFKTLDILPADYSRVDITQKYPLVEYILSPSSTILYCAYAVQYIPDLVQVYSPHSIRALPGLRAPPIV